MSISRRMAWFVAAIVATVSFGIAGQVKAADPVPKIGVVDTEKLTTSPRFKQYDEELTKFVEDLRAKLTIRKQKLMLNETEIKELVDLKIKANPTAQDQERIKALEETEKQRDAELKQLQETKDATEQQKARLKELQDMRQKSTDTGEALEKDYQSAWQSKAQTLDVQFATEVQDAIKAVAQAKGLTLVLAKMQVLYGGTDVTDDVIAKLDRKIQ